MEATYIQGEEEEEDKANKMCHIQDCVFIFVYCFIPRRAFYFFFFLRVCVCCM